MKFSANVPTSEKGVNKGWCVTVGERSVTHLRQKTIDLPTSRCHFVGIDPEEPMRLAIIPDAGKAMLVIATVCEHLSNG
jgi:hypothetical protein